MGAAEPVTGPAVSGGGARVASDPPVVTLDQAIRLALENDPAAIAAEGAVASASADLLQARGAWLPSVNIGSGYSNSSNQRFDQASGQLVSQSYTAQLTGSYQLFAGGRRLVQQRAAGARVASAEAAYLAQRYQTVLRTTAAFYEAAAAGELVELAERRLDRARQQLDFAQSRLEVGTATRSDVLRAELEVGNAELAVVDAESARRSAYLNLGRRLGLESGAVPATTALPERAPDLPPMEQLVQKAEHASPEALSARSALEESRAARLAARTNYLPTLNLTGGYDWLSFDFPPDNRSWSLRVVASFPLFNGFQREANLARAAATERTAQARARDAAVGARIAVEDAARELASAERRIDISRRAVDLAREDLRVQEERYQIGNATIVELQTSQVALADAEVAYVRARQSLGVAIARLEAIIGQRLDRDR